MRTQGRRRLSAQVVITTAFTKIHIRPLLSILSLCTPCALCYSVVCSTKESTRESEAHPSLCTFITQRWHMGGFWAGEIVPWKPEFLFQPRSDYASRIQGEKLSVCLSWQTKRNFSSWSNLQWPCLKTWTKRNSRPFIKWPGKWQLLYSKNYGITKMCKWKTIGSGKRSRSRSESTAEIQGQGKLWGA